MALWKIAAGNPAKEILVNYLGAVHQPPFANSGFNGNDFLVKRSGESWRARLGR